MTTVIRVPRPAGPPAPPDPDHDHTRSAGVQLVPASTTDTDAVLAMLSRCSRQSLYHRFHGYTDGVTHTRRLLAGGRHDEILLAWTGSTCVGFATVSCDDQGRGHLGVLVEDAWQRHGIGSRLIGGLVEAARLRGLARVHADVLGEDQFLLRVLRRVGPINASISLGTYSVDVALGHGYDVDLPVHGFSSRESRLTEPDQLESPLHARPNIDESRLTA